MAADDYLLLTSHHHSDLVWRRTRDGYGDIRERQILQVLKYLRRDPEYCHTFVQTEVVSDFLRRHPELKPEFAGYVTEGRIELQGGVIGISDVNLPCGEALLRNMVLGRRWLAENFGVLPDIAWFMDDFGMNGQLPQICRHAGFSALLPGRAPGLAPEVTGNAWRWEGIDGTVMPAVRTHAELQLGTHVCNLPVAETIPMRLRTSLLALWDREGTTWGMMSTEENMFEDVVFDDLRELATEPGRRPFRWATAAAYLATLDPASLPLHRGELNPEFTGCYTSHIRLKLQNRRAEAALTAAEAASVAAGIATAAPWPAVEINSLWELLFICQFHDGICGCHIDAVYDELMGWYDRILAEAGTHCRAALERSAPAAAEAGTVIFNPILGDRREPVRTTTALVAADGTPVPAQCDGGGVLNLVRLPSVGSARFTAGDGAATAEVINDPDILRETEVETAEYRIRVRDGKVHITPKFTPVDLLPGADFATIRCREDGGDMWTESYLGTVLPASVNCERVERIECGPVFTRIRVAGDVVAPPRGVGHGCVWDGFSALSWHREFTFYEGLRRFDVDIELLWQGSRTEIMVDFPVGVDPVQAKAIYEVPFGAIERRPYYEVDKQYEATVQPMLRGEYNRAKGNWPTLGWVDYADGQGGLALANSGTPGHRCQNGVITVSLLRSPTAMSSHYHPGVTAQDNGRRCYRFSCLPHTGDGRPAALGLGQALNHPPVIAEASSADATGSILATGADNIVLSALKRAEDGEGIVIRLYESLGRATEAELTLGFECRDAWDADANEVPIERLDNLKLGFRPFEIKTLLLR